MATLMHFETTAVVMVLAAVLGWLLSRIRSRRWRVPVMGLVAFFLVAAAWTATLRVPPLGEEDITIRPVAIPENGYVSSETCRSCHPQAYSTWHSSYHRRMTQVVKPETALGDFDNVLLNYHGETYYLGRDEEVWFEADRPTAEGSGRPRRIRRPIVMSTGSHHMQAYWYPTGYKRALEFFPFVYLLPEEQWVPRESIFLQPTVPLDVPLKPPNETEEWQKNRQWNYSCIHCHTTDGQPRFPEIDTRVGEFGIACEACHGPAQEHIARNRDPARRYRLHFDDTPDPTIVNPRRLSAKRASQICGACHGITSPRPDEIKNHFGTGRTYRPGDELSDTRFICQASLGPDAIKDCDIDPEHRFWSDGMVRVSGREYGGLIDSPCFRGGELSCLSCHVMHQEEDDARPVLQWASDQLAVGMEGDPACVQCHTALGDPDGAAAHSHHSAGSSGSRCYNCHMPYTSYGLLKALRSHQISSPSVEASLETGRPNACNQCHLDKTLAWSAGYLDQWYGLPQPELGDLQRAVPASLIWLLSGDAGQRALMAWSMGWEPALEASGPHWMPPFLAQLLIDPYDAVRLIAGRSLRRHRGFEQFDYNFLAPARERLAAARRARDAGQAEAGLTDLQARYRDAAPTLPEDLFAHLLSRRDDRVVMLTE